MKIANWVNMKKVKTVPDNRRNQWYRQRKKYGFDNRELWSLDMTIAEFALPRLKRFKEINHGVPGCFCSEEGDKAWEDGNKKWNKILDDMIYAMEITSDDEKWNDGGVDHKRVRRGCKLFGEYFLCLWY